ncbi:alpha-L-fucosidase [Ferruginibacter paludis]|uniref:alpha-L-fucosidase n=1 Tax=Ferruginibacter paludis TaxID=1310417 RepID=UPI0025B59C62|nr:alpha-L-fucosidase [Ferruginibacter paludis]MDN3654663.1 alpha-L-fucosidase [Ferruginibacter paludis]
MSMRKIWTFLLMASFLMPAVAQQVQPLPPVPSAPQVAWHNMEYYWFTHFGPNTFTDKEWGHGDEPEDIFNPTQLDCRQWARTAKAAGAKGIIITAKHHDGFCLWPSKYSTHTIRESKWRNGKGDILKELSQACKEYGLKFGVYLSPWDRNHPKYGTPAYNEVFVNMMKEIFANYGPIWEFWWDGANGEGPNGKKQEYDWPLFRKTIKKLSPNTVVFSDVGPQVRWVGNESGVAGTTNWNLLNISGFTAGAGAPSTDTLNSGNMYGEKWIPAECDVSIRPGWFYHKEEDDKVKSPETLFNLYLKSVGRGSTLLLNVPPDRRGLINEHDSASLIGFRKLRETNFKTNLFASPSAVVKNNAVSKRITTLTDGKQNTFEQLKSVTVQLKSPVTINTIVLQEPIQMGQRVIKFKIELQDANGATLKEINGTTIGRKRILTFMPVAAKKVEVIIEDSKAVPLISEIAAYNINDQLIEQ